MPLRQLKRVLCKLGLKRRVTRYSVRHLQQVEELIRVSCNYICSTTVTQHYSWKVSEQGVFPLCLIPFGQISHTFASVYDTSPYNQEVDS